MGWTKYDKHNRNTSFLFFGQMWANKKKAIGWQPNSEVETNPPPSRTFLFVEFVIELAQAFQRSVSPGHYSRPSNGGITARSTNAPKRPKGPKQIQQDPRTRSQRGAKKVQKRGPTRSKKEVQ